MINLVASLPADKNTRISSKTVEKCRLQVLEFNAYVILTNCLRRTFISAKGVYHQAEIMGEIVTWIVPHKLGKVIPSDVDFPLLETFLEFYITLSTYVKDRLFYDIGIDHKTLLNNRLGEEL